VSHGPYIIKLLYSVKKKSCEYNIFIIFIGYAMKIWTFKAFLTFNGRNLFQEWITSLDVDAEERIRAIIRRMEVTKKWERPYFDSLHGHKSIYKIRVKSGGKNYRPLGCYGPDVNTFVLLVGASKTSNRRKLTGPLRMPQKQPKLDAN
jgi:hypothetical protein